MEPSAWATVTDVLPAAAAPAPLRVHLVVVNVEDANAEPRVLDLEDGAEVSFGRASGVTVVIDDARISRKHALVRRSGGDVFVRDLGSRNGTRVRSETLKNEEKLVAAGDSVHLGPAEIFVAAVTGARDAVSETVAEEEDEGEHYDGVVVADPAMQKVFRLARRLAQAPTTVLIVGEGGAGKEVVAEQIHRASARASAPFTRHHVSADHDLFAAIDTANGGSLFVDEIANVALPLQVRLLRVIESKAPVRFIFATTKNLKNEVSAGRMREDLYYRISTFTLQVPPLRDRPAEITLLAELFARHFAASMQLATPALGPDARAALLKHAWPGNVRELKAAMEHAVVLAEGSAIREEHLPEAVRHQQAPPAPIESAQAMKEQFIEVERRNVEAALAAENWNQTRAARKLGITRRMLIYKMAKLGVGRRR